MHIPRLNLMVGWALLAVAGGCTSPQGGRQAAQATRQQAPPAHRQDVSTDPDRTHRLKTGATRIALPGILLDMKAGELQIDGRVCIDEGILEYLAVADGGKAYESVFELHCRPSHLQAAMLIAGYEQGEVPPELRGDLSPQANPAANIPPQGAPNVTRPPDAYWQQATAEPTSVTVEVDVREDDGHRLKTGATWRRRPIENFLIDRHTGQPPQRLTWAFTGSFFHREESIRVEFFVADVEKSLIALWYDPTALLNLAQEAGNPYRGGEVGYEINPAQLPAKGTPIRLILHKSPR